VCVQRGAINFAEFEAAHYRGQLGSDSTAIRRAFDSFDAQHTGVIQLSEVRAVLGDEGAAAVEELVSAVGSYKGDGQISFQTFLEAMTSGTTRFE
jgi:Ca2+-binding EF-hand superfamily protein